MAKRTKYTVDNYLEETFGDSIQDMSTKLVIESITDFLQPSFNQREVSAKLFFIHHFSELRKAIIRMNAHGFLDVNVAISIMQEARILHNKIDRAFLSKKIIDAVKTNKLGGMKIIPDPSDEEVNKALENIWTTNENISNKNSEKIKILEKTLEKTPEKTQVKSRKRMVSSDSESNIQEPPVKIRKVSESKEQKVQKEKKGQTQKSTTKSKTEAKAKKTAKEKKDIKTNIQDLFDGLPE